MKALFMREFAFVFIFGLCAWQNLSAQPTVAFTFSGNNVQEHLGEAAIGLGDVNSDGIPDILVASPGFHYQATNPTAGSVRVYSGADGSLIHQIIEPMTGTSFGFSVGNAGDVNNDGFPDFIVGAPGDSTMGLKAGRADVYSGFDGSLLHRAFGPNAGDQFGFSVSGVDDLNGDGSADFIVGVPNSDFVGVNAGAIQVFSGANGSVLYTIFGSAPGDIFGVSVSGCGDVNGDNTPDFIVGAADAGLSLQGQAKVFSGANGATLHVVTGPSGTRVGVAVGSIGDIDQDGYDDFIVSAPGVGLSLAGKGKVRAYSGINGAPIFTVSGQHAAEEFGSRLGPAGDVNGDGFNDIIVGSPLSDASFVDGGRATIISGKDGAILHNLPGLGFQSIQGISVAIIGDINLDGFSDFIIGASAESDNAPHSGNVRVYLAPTLPILKYDSKVGDTQLDLNWMPDSGDINSLTGTLSCTGGTPGGFGIVGLSFAPADLIIFGIPLLVASDSTNLIETGNFGFDLLGELQVPNVSRQSPFIAGSLVHIQMFESSPAIRSSNGIRMLMTP